MWKFKVNVGKSAWDSNSCKIFSRFWVFVEFRNPALIFRKLDLRPWPSGLEDTTGLRLLVDACMVSFGNPLPPYSRVIVFKILDVHATRNSPQTSCSWGVKKTKNKKIPMKSLLWRKGRSKGLNQNLYLETCIQVWTLWRPFGFLSLFG